VGDGGAFPNNGAAKCLTLHPSKWMSLESQGFAEPLAGLASEAKTQHFERRWQWQREVLFDHVPTLQME
jgi:hypothetical protein